MLITDTTQPREHVVTLAELDYGDAFRDQYDDSAFFLLVSPCGAPKVSTRDAYAVNLTNGLLVLVPLDRKVIPYDVTEIRVLLRE